MNPSRNGSWYSMVLSTQLLSTESFPTGIQFPAYDGLLWTNSRLKRHGLPASKDGNRPIRVKLTMPAVLPEADAPAVRHRRRLRQREERNRRRAAAGLPPLEER